MHSKILMFDNNEQWRIFLYTAVFTRIKKSRPFRPATRLGEEVCLTFWSNNIVIGIFL